MYLLIAPIYPWVRTPGHAFIQSYERDLSVSLDIEEICSCKKLIGNP